MPLHENETARASELHAIIAELRPQVQERRQLSIDRGTHARQTGKQAILQAASQALGTLAAACVIYLVAVVAGALEGTEPLTIVVSSIAVAGLVAMLWALRRLVLPSHRAQERLLSAEIELLAVTVRAKLRDGEPLTMREAKALQDGWIRLAGTDSLL